jgi:hypothetical protein
MGAKLPSELAVVELPPLGGPDPEPKDNEPKPEEESVAAKPRLSRITPACPVCESEHIDEVDADLASGLSARITSLRRHFAPCTEPMNIGRMLIRRCRSLDAVRFDHRKLAATGAGTAPRNSPGAGVQAGASHEPGPGLEFVAL